MRFCGLLVCGGRLQHRKDLTQHRKSRQEIVNTDKENTDKTEKISVLPIHVYKKHILFGGIAI